MISLPPGDAVSTLGQKWDAAAVQSGVFHNMHVLFVQLYNWDAAMPSRPSGGSPHSTPHLTVVCIYLVCINIRIIVCITGCHTACMYL